MNDANLVVQTLTEGLRELPTDDAARVKYFLLEYLGNAQRPVPFGGRGHDFEYLDAWLAERMAPAYLLLAAPAGRGKSALLLRWCQHLLTRSDLAVVYFPVSIRFRTNLAGVVFPALVALLAHLHGEKLPANPNVQEEVWRGLLTEYMTRPLPDGRLLVLVLDGVDEAADWSADSTLFPANPPASLRVVLSARYLANDQDASAWLGRLGWTRPGLARTFELYPLDRNGITSVLVQMGFPLNLPGARVDIVSELHRLSEGDPLLIRLYIDDLWEQGAARARQFQPEDLHMRRPGLVGYFERWWNEQRLLWQNTAAQSEAAAQSVLNLLAGAFGPLSQKDIIRLAGDETGLNAENFAEHLSPLARFVIGDGMRQGYVFSHPRLANYFLEERLSSPERQEIEQRFLAWGSKTLADLNTGDLAPEQASAYIVQYYGTHLERAQSETPALLALVSDGWRRAWEKLDRAQSGFLGDSERAWRAAERENATAISQGLPAPYLGAEIRCLLCRVSINSMTNNIAPRLMLEAVKTGVWTPAQGLASIRLIADLVPRARELVGLAPYVLEPLRTDILQEALDTLLSLKDERSRLDVLVELAPGFATGQLEQILEIVPTIEDEADRAGVLAEVVLACSSEHSLIEKALHTTQNIEEEEYRSLALVGLTTTLAEEQLVSALQLAREIQDERYRVQALTTLIPRLSASQNQEILQDARLMWDNLSRLRLLATLANHAADETQNEALQEALELLHEIIDQEYRVELLLKLAPVLAPDQLHLTLQEIQHLGDESYRAQMLGALLPYLPDEHMPDFLQAVQAMKNEEQRATIFHLLIPNLPETLLELVLQSVQTTWDEGLRVELLAKLLPVCPDNLRPKILALIQAIKDPGYRIWLLAELETIQSSTALPLPFEIRQTFQTIQNADERLQIFLAILPRLSNDALARISRFMLPEIFSFRGSIRSEDRQAEILAKLCSRLPAEWFPSVLDLVRKMHDETYQVQVLQALALRMQEKLLPDALDIVRSMKEREKRSQVLEVLVSVLPEADKGEHVREMLQVLQIIKDENQRALLAATFMTALPGMFPSTSMPVIIASIWEMRMEIHQANILVALVSHLPEESYTEVLHLVTHLHEVEERARVLQAMAPHISKSTLTAFFAAVQNIQDERWRAQVLAAILAQASKSTFAEILEMVQKIRNEKEQMELLGTMVLHAPENAVAQLWPIIQNIQNNNRRTWVLGALALRRPEEFFWPLWEEVGAIQDEAWQMWILDALTPHMSEDFFSRLWTVVQRNKNLQWQQRVIVRLAPAIPERYFPQVFQTVQASSPEEEEAGDVLEALAAHVPASFFSQFWNSLDTLSNEMLQASLQVLLVKQVPEDCFPQVWKAVLATDDTWQQASLLEALAPRVPPDYFKRVWELAKNVTYPTKRPKILITLIPCCPQELHLQIMDEAHYALTYAQTRVFQEHLLPYLSEEQAEEMLKTLLPLLQLSGEQETLQNRERLHLLTRLVPLLSQKLFLALLPDLFTLVGEIDVERNGIALLTRLAPRVPAESLSEMLELLWSKKLMAGRERILAALLPTLSPSGWGKLLELAMTKLQETGETQMLLELLKAIGKTEHPPKPDLLYPTLNALLHLLTQQTRQQTLEDLNALAPAILASGNATAIPEACCAALELGLWWP